MIIFLFLLLALAGEVICTLCGISSSFLFVPMANFFFGFRTVLGLMSLLHIFSNLSKLFLFRKHINFKLAGLYAVPGTIFVITGSLLTLYICPRDFEVFLGIFLITLGAFLLLFPKWNLPRTQWSALAVGGVSGFLSGLVGTGSVLRGIGMKAYNLRKKIFIATSAAVDFTVGIGRSVIYLKYDYLDSKHLIYIPVLVLIAVAGSWIGKKVVRKVPKRYFMKFILIFAIVAGASILYKYFL